MSDVQDIQQEAEMAFEDDEKSAIMTDRSDPNTARALLSEKTNQPVVGNVFSPLVDVEKISEENLIK